MRASGRRRLQAKLQAGHAELVLQAQRQPGHSLQQCVAVELQPQRSVDVARPGGQAVGRFDASRGRLHEVGAAHLLQRPAGDELPGPAFGGVVQATTHRACLVARHGEEALAQRRLQAWVLQHLERGLEVGERATLALGELEQQALARAVLLDLARDVLQHQHEARDRGWGLGRHARGLARRADVVGGENGGHLRPQQLARGRDRDELRGRLAGAALQALLQILERVRHELAVEDGVDRAPEPDRPGPVGDPRCGREGAELQARALVVEQHASVEVADHHALREFAHQRGQAPALLLDPAAGLGHLAGHVGAQGLALCRQRIDRRGQRAHIGRPGRVAEFAPHSRGGQHRRLLGQLHRGRHPAPVQRQGRRRCQADERDAHQHQRLPSTVEQGRQRLALGIAHVRPQQQHAAAGEGAQQQGGGQGQRSDGGDEAAVGLHRGALQGDDTATPGAPRSPASISRTF